MKKSNIYLLVWRKFVLDSNDYSYILDQDETRISVSVTTVEFKSTGAGTQLVYTEQGAFLDGHDTPEQREHGTKFMLDKLGDELKSQ
jgi:uncharacterized protein YndB with AHSA1/START domain